MASNEVGERVQKVRKDLKLNQRDFAARLGTSSGHVSEIESGKTVPGGEFLRRLATEFRADTTYILTGDDQWRRAVTAAGGAGDGALEKLDQATTPTTMGQTVTTWRENMEMIIDIVLHRPTRAGLTGKIVLTMVDKVTEMEHAGLKVTGEMLETMLDNFIKGRS